MQPHFGGAGTPSERPHAGCAERAPWNAATRICTSGAAVKGRRAHSSEPARGFGGAWPRRDPRRLRRGASQRDRARTRVAKDLVCQWREWRAEPAPGTHFTILISNLAGDAMAARPRACARCSSGSADSTCGARAAWSGSMRSAASVATPKRGLGAKDGRCSPTGKADLLIWGEVKKADQELSLWFLPAAAAAASARPSYSLTEKITLPENFRADLGAQLQAVALAQVAPATEQAGTYLVDLLVPVRAKLQQLLTNPPPGPERRTAGGAAILPGIGGPDDRRAIWRERTARSGGVRVSRRPGGQDPRARPARLGHDPEQPRQRALDARRARGRHRAARTRRSPPIAPRSRSGPASASRSTGP